MKPFHKEGLGKVRTKIVATVGPASSDPAVLKQMVEAGVDVFRLNFSHGTYEEHTQRLQAIRRISEETGIQLAILQDLCGPKIRLEEIPGGVVACDFEAEFILSVEPNSGGDPHHLTCTYRALPTTSRSATSVLFADGTVAMEVIAHEPGRAQAQGDAPGPDPVPPGDQCTRGAPERFGTDGQGPGGPGMDGDPRGRLCRALVRPPARRT